MERAKRLEQGGLVSQAATTSYTCESEVSAGAPGDAPEGKSSKESATDHASLSRIGSNEDAELREIISAWSKLNQAFKSAILSIVRAI